MARLFASGNYLEVPSNAAFDGSVGTFAFWMKTTQTTGNTAIFARWSGTSRQGFCALMNNTANKITLIGYDTSAQRVGLASTTSVNGGGWRHVAMVYDRTTAANGNKVYVDGAMEAQGASSGAWAMGANVVRVAKVVDNFWGAYVGDLADICHWSQQLTADEIYALSKGASPQKVRPAALELHIPCWA